MTRPPARGRWIWQPAPWSPNPLMRRSDRIEGVIRILAALVVLAAVPAAIVAGTAGYTAAETRIRADNAAKSAVTAVITDVSVRASPAAEVPALRPRVQAGWNADGHTGTATLHAVGTVRPGDRIPLWVDPNGQPTSAPVATDAATIQGFGIGFLTLVGCWAAAAGLVRGAGRVLDKHRDDAWRQEWRRLGAVGD
ncbi:Rv1733c family protein [Nocardia otitidiscaviarum]|uniref:Rv1733c family protein n=1 Tax=Nocardia otitidiscaviarum TaxID=1823 RepID=UPI003F6A019E